MHAMVLITMDDYVRRYNLFLVGVPLLTGRDYQDKDYKILKTKR